MSKGKLPKGWKITKCKDLFTQLRGITYSKEDAFSIESENAILVLRGGNVQEGKIVRNPDDVFVLEQLVKDDQKLRKGDVVIVSSTGSKNLIGKAATVREDSEKISFGAFLTLLRPNQKVNHEFFGYFYQTDFYRKSIRDLSGGVNINNIRKEHLAEIDFPLPPLPEQQRIVAKLDAVFGHLDRVREKLDRIPELLKNFRQQVLTQAVTGELSREWREGKDLGEWEYEKAENCCFKVQSGGTPKSDGFAETGIPFLKVYNIVNNQIDFDYKPQFVTLKAHTTTIKKSILLPGDVLMNIVGPPLNKIAIVPNDYEEWNLNQAITLFRPKDYLINKFLYYFFCEGSSVRSVYNETRGVVGQVNISLSQCRNFEIPIPSLEEQQEIVKRVDALFGLADKIESQYQSLKAKIDQMPQAILAKAFRGELVEQEVKEYVREIGELGMVAEEEVKTF